MKNIFCYNSILEHFAAFFYCGLWSHADRTQSPSQFVNLNISRRKIKNKARTVSCMAFKAMKPHYNKSKDYIPH